MRISFFAQWNNNKPDLSGQVNRSGQYLAYPYKVMGCGDRRRTMHLKTVSVVCLKAQCIANRKGGERKYLHYVIEDHQVQTGK